MMPVPREPEKTFDSAVALAFAARAAVSWYGSSARSDALRQVMTAMSALARATRTVTARKPNEFLSLLTLPVSTWLPGHEDQPLVEDGCPTSYCIDVNDESGPDPVAELAQSRVGASRAVFALREAGDREYRAFRNYLATHGHAKHFDAVREIAPSQLDLADLYEAIPSGCLIRVGNEAGIVPCPRCTWPMQVVGDDVACVSPQCRIEGACFRKVDEALVPLGEMRAPAIVDARDRLRLRRGVWRYTLLPGLAELELARKLEAVDGTSTELWPQRDRYDLHVRRDTCEWLVDVKDWSSLGALASRLVAQNQTDEVWIVIPDHRRRQLNVLEERCKDTRYRFATVDGFVRTVARLDASGGKR